MIHHRKEPEATAEVVFRLQEHLNHRTIVDSLGGKTEAFDWLKQAFAIDDEAEFRHQMEAETMHNTSLYNEGFIPGKLVIFRYGGNDGIYIYILFIF